MAKILKLKKTIMIPGPNNYILHLKKGKKYLYLPVMIKNRQIKTTDKNTENTTISKKKDMYFNKKELAYFLNIENIDSELKRQLIIHAQTSPTHKHFGYHVDKENQCDYFFITAPFIDMEYPQYRFLNYQTYYEETDLKSALPYIYDFLNSNHTLIPLFLYGILSFSNGFIGLPFRLNYHTSTMYKNNFTLCVSGDSYINAKKNVGLLLNMFHWCHSGLYTSEKNHLDITSRLPLKNLKHYMKPLANVPMIVYSKNSMIPKSSTIIKALLDPVSLLNNKTYKKKHPYDFIELDETCLNKIYPVIISDKPYKHPFVLNVHTENISLKNSHFTKKKLYLPFIKDAFNEFYYEYITYIQHLTKNSDYINPPPQNSQEENPYDESKNPISPPVAYLSTLKDTAMLLEESLYFNRKSIDGYYFGEDIIKKLTNLLLSVLDEMISEYQGKNIKRVKPQHITEDINSFFESVNKVIYENINDPEQSIIWLDKHKAEKNNIADVYCVSTNALKDFFKYQINVTERKLKQVLADKGYIFKNGSTYVFEKTVNKTKLYFYKIKKPLPEI